MGQVFRAEGFQVFVYAPPREHEPPHVHVECAKGGEVVIALGDNETAPSVWKNHHMRAVDARHAIRIVEWNQDRFIQEWRRLHGT